jgi:hypothetical protein
MVHKNTTARKMGVPEHYDKKRRMARRRLKITRNANSGCRFCDSGKTIPGNGEKKQARKRGCLLNGHHHAS